MPVAAEDGADHGGIALAARIGAQLGDMLLAAFDFGGAVSLIGEGGENEPLDPIRARSARRRRRG